MIVLASRKPISLRNSLGCRFFSRQQVTIWAGLFFFFFLRVVFFKIFIYFYLFFSVRGLHRFGCAFSSCGEWGLLIVPVHRLLSVVASLLWSTGSRHVGLSSCYSPALELGLSGCGAWAYLLCGMWDLPDPGIKPGSPALQADFFTIWATREALT